MIWIERQAIHPHASVVAEPFHVLFAGVVTALAQALQFPEPELVDVTAPRLNVVRYVSSSHFAFGQARPAQRLDPQLMLGYPSPTLGSIKAHRIPPCGDCLHTVSAGP
ncbi:MAG TPA: hypothetical protein VM910_16690 [Bradyrhizobium sp.]|nr:hypothetical protein [Bradyrhizobium sp.]